MQKTKIEVLLDKMQLVLEEAGANLDEMEQRLLAKYSRQLTEMLEGQHSTKEVAAGPAQQSHSEPPKAKPSASREESASTKQSAPPSSQEEAPPAAKSSPETNQEDQPQAKPKVNPLDEEEPEADKEVENTMNFSFVEDEKETETAPQPSTGEETGNDKGDYHEEIYRNLEEIKRKRSANKDLVGDDEDSDEEEEGEAPMPEKDTEPSVNDRFRHEESDLVNHLKATPIKNLQREIDLNDKFWFINELFDGDATTFNNLLKELDQLHSFEDAKAKIDKLGKEKYGWSADDRAVNKLYQTVRRRYL